MLIDYDTLIPIAVIIYAISLTVLKKKKNKIYSNFAVKYSLLSLEKSIIHSIYIPVKMPFYTPFSFCNTRVALQ